MLVDGCGAVRLCLCWDGSGWSGRGRRRRKALRRRAVSGVVGDVVEHADGEDCSSDEDRRDYGGVEQEANHCSAPLL